MIDRRTVLLSTLFLLAAVPAGGEPIVCEDHVLAVALAPGEPADYHVVGTLCSQGPAAGKTLQLLQHGGTYSRIYWDFPYEAARYSYVRNAIAAGYATFNLDRLGNGASDHPNGLLPTLVAQVYVGHQVIAALRRGEIGGVAFEKIIAVGHSLGSVVSKHLAGTYPEDVDGVILTGFVHDYDPEFAPLLGESLYPATLDPRFAGQFPAFDYLTTMPGARETLFYYAPTTDPTVVAIDESTKGTLCLGEGVEPAGPTSQWIEAPLLLVIGNQDKIFCGPGVDHCSSEAAVAAWESAFYSAAASLEVVVVPEAGHDLNLHTNADVTYAAMIEWANRRVGPGACVAGPTNLCLNRGRFRVEVDWRSFDDQGGAGQVVPFAAGDSGAFWFFGLNNWEILVKVLDGCRVNGHFWVFAAGSTNLEYTIRVTDTATGSPKEYFNPLGRASAAITDTRAFATCP